MFITCITHAEARDKQDVFRGLTEVGWWQVDSAAQRFRALTTFHELPHIGAIISSPKARCLETAVLLAKALSNFELLDASEVQVDAGLKGWRRWYRSAPRRARSNRRPRRARPPSL